MFGLCKGDRGRAFLNDPGGEGYASRLEKGCWLKKKGLLADPAPLHPPPLQGLGWPRPKFPYEKNRGGHTKTIKKSAPKFERDKNRGGQLSAHMCQKKGVNTVILTLWCTNEVRQSQNSFAGVARCRKDFKKFFVCDKGKVFWMIYEEGGGPGAGSRLLAGSQPLAGLDTPPPTPWGLGGLKSALRKALDRRPTSFGGGQLPRGEAVAVHEASSNILQVLPSTRLLSCSIRPSTDDGGSNERLAPLAPSDRKSETVLRE